MPKRYHGESLDDAADRRHAEHVQALLDAYVDGQRVGEQGLGAGLCPQDLSDDEQREWRRGHLAGQARRLGRKAA